MKSVNMLFPLILFCAATLGPAPAFCDEQEQQEIYLPADISKTLTFKPLKDQAGYSASKSSDTAASSEYLAAPAAPKSTTYIFVNKDDSADANQKRWTTPSKKKSGATAANTTKKTKIKKLQVSRAGFADTSFAKEGSKSGLKDRKDSDEQQDYKDDKVIVR